MKSLIKKMFLGRKCCQRLFSRLFSISLEALNIGTGGRHPDKNGELWVLEYVLSAYAQGEALTIFDGGAQIGVYTECVLKTLEKLGKIGTVYGFEPSSNEYKQYAGNYSSRGVKTFNVALSDEVGTKNLYSPKNSTGLSSLHVGNRKGEAQQVKVTTIDVICGQKNIRKIHFLKLDVEGNELSVLKGGKEIIKNDLIDFIQFEFGMCSLYAGVSFRDLFDTLSEKYNVYRILCDGLEEIKNPSIKEEMFYTTNYLAQRKNK